MRKRLVLVLSILGFAHLATADELFKANLSGDQEVPPLATVTSGKVFLLLNKAPTELDITLHLNAGFRIQQSHIHCAPAGANGPVVVFLAGNHPAGLNVDGKWVSNGTITDSSIVNPACGATVSALAASIRAGNTYVNVHSVAHPGGEVRGQLGVE